MENYEEGGVEVFKDESIAGYFGEQFKWNIIYGIPYITVLSLISWKGLGSFHLNRTAFVFFKTSGAFFLVVFYISAYLTLYYKELEVKKVLATVTIVSCHLFFMFSGITIQSSAYYRIGFNDSAELGRNRYIFLSIILGVAELFTLFFRPEIYVFVDPDKNAVANKIAGGCLIVFHAFAFLMISTAWLCFRAPYFVIRRNNFEIGRLIYQDRMWKEVLLDMDYLTLTQREELIKSLDVACFPMSDIVI
ncbi:hypothetical protein GCK72_013704 [Caenorhabditis remanei]|uniref:Uncharacterized protein n=1 Tax=Caenorhabditis remanei TaxID=31234 RepID=A0A6A5GS00_CAERE|nr:hypothetical protein GCK72_013704 [Caenorhabditis remanei]KAF1757249.1 hypothetical protein GCK72_013704 [Caenorhabditis remanei]